MPEDKNKKGYTIFHSNGAIKEVAPEHTPIIDKLAADNSDESINNFYNPNHIPSNTVKITKDNITKDYDVRSKEYKDLYDSGHLVSYDAKTNTYHATPLPEVTITAERPQWAKDKMQFEKEYTKDMFIDEIMPKWSRSMGISSTNMHPNNVATYDKIINDKVVENIFKRKPTFDTDYSNDRLKTLQEFTQKELELIKNSSYSSKIEPSIWSKFEQGLLSIGNTGSPVTFKNENLTQEEAKKEDNPLNILQPLNIPSKMVQSAYKDDYSFTDALKGKQNNAGIVEDIVTDPLNLVGAGLVGKLSKADKVIDATKILNKIDNNSFYRQIGKEGYEDAIKTGVIRSNPIGEYAGKAPYFVEGKDFDKLYSTGAGAYGKKPKYIFEMPQLKNPEEMSAFRINQQEGYAPYVAGSKEIPISQGKIYRLNNKNEYELVDATKVGSKEGQLNKLLELEVLTEKEIAQKRADRLLAQKNKWVGQDDKLLEEQLKNAGKNHENNLTAQEFNIKYNSSKSPSNIGINKEGKTFIFKDSPLTELNKKRVAAHEVGHYYRNTLEEGLEWDKYFDFTGISHREKKYLRGKGLTGNGSVKGDELRERAAQLKDFIAVKNNIPLDKDFVITPSQFNDALKNYVKETGLDNNMEIFIKAIKNKKGLLKEMNKKALGIAPAALYLQSQEQNKSEQ